MRKINIINFVYPFYIELNSKKKKKNCFDKYIIIWGCPGITYDIEKGGRPKILKVDGVLFAQPFIGLNVPLQYYLFYLFQLI